MSADTIDANRDRHDFSNMQEIWLFAYGSLLYKQDFPVIESRQASVSGWARRFWQGSHDHRGTPEAPGRVVTLVPSAHNHCAGLALRVDAAVFKHLDHREKNGYLRCSSSLNLAAQPSQAAELKQGIIYIADENNTAWLGAASAKEIARHIHSSAGPSGANSDYVFQLADALRELGAQDEHVFNIERELKVINRA